MFSKIVSSDTVFVSSIWSVQYFSIPKSTTSSALFPLVRIRDVAEERKQTVNPQSNQFFDYIYVGLENIESNIRTLSMSALKTGSDIKSTAKLFNKGDILYGKLRPNLNKIFLVDSTIPTGIC